MKVIAGDDEIGIHERALVVTAHPDDVDFGAAGTVARLVGAGTEVHYLVLTDGDAGGFDPAVDRSLIPGIRRAEQISAASKVGVKDVEFLGYPDGRLEVTFALRRQIARKIREVRPSLVISNSPERDLTRIFASHPDHLASGEATISAVYPDARNPFAYPELLADLGLEPWTVTEMWLMASPQSDLFVDVTDHLETKLAAIRAHASQLPDFESTSVRVAGMLSGMALKAGLPEGSKAEGFQAVSTA